MEENKAAAREKQGKGGVMKPGGGSGSRRSKWSGILKAADRTNNMVTRK